MAYRVIAGPLVTARKALHLLNQGRGQDAHLIVFKASAMVSRDFLDDQRLAACRREDEIAGETLAAAAQTVIDMQALASQYGLAVPVDVAGAYRAAMPVIERGLAVDPELYIQLNTDPSAWE